MKAAGADCYKVKTNSLMLYLILFGLERSGIVGHDKSVEVEISAVFQDKFDLMLTSLEVVMAAHVSKSAIRSEHGPSHELGGLMARHFDRIIVDRNVDLGLLAIFAVSADHEIVSAVLRNVDSVLKSVFAIEDNRLSVDTERICNDLDLAALSGDLGRFESVDVIRLVTFFLQFERLDIVVGLGIERNTTGETVIKSDDEGSAIVVASVHFLRQDLDGENDLVTGLHHTFGGSN